MLIQGAAGLALAALVALAAAPLDAQANERFVSLAVDEAEGRRAASEDAPIDWIYVGRWLPLKVLAESGPWLRVRDPNGGEVWMHANDLDAAQTVYIVGGRRGETALRRAPRRDAPTSAMLERGVIGRVMECRPDWVRIETAGYSGWVRSEAVWGGSACS